MIYFILGILSWQLVTTIVLLVSDQDEEKTMITGTGVFYIILTIIGFILNNIIKIDWRERQYKKLLKKWRKARIKENYNFLDFRTENEKKFFVSAFNKLVTSEEFKNFQKSIDK